MKSTIHELQKSSSKFASKTLQAILLLFILSFITISCSKDNEPVQESKTPIYLLSKIIYGVNYSKFIYDSENTLIINETTTSNGGIFHTNIFYNVKGKISETIKRPIAGNSTKIEKQTYTYDLQNRLIEKKTFKATTALPDDFALDVTITYIYNQTNIEYRYKPANSIFATLKTVYELDSSNNYLVVKGYKNLSATDAVGIIDWTTTSEYDNKKNPLSNIPDEYVILEKTINNQTRSTSPQFNPTVVNKTYEYNQDGYPTKSINGNSTVTFEYIVK